MYPTRSQRSLVVAAIAVALVVGSVWAVRTGAADETPETPDTKAPSVSAPTPTTEPPNVEPPKVALEPAPVAPPPPPTPTPRIPGRYPMEVPFNTTGGIGIGAGRFLPLLNGVPHAPEIARDEPGPVPPVVAKVVDDSGCEWWEHADGSMTTSRWNDYTYRDPRTGEQVQSRQVVTEHGIPMRGEVPEPANEAPKSPVRR
jgi:hypothetical protein